MFLFSLTWLNSYFFSEFGGEKMDEEKRRQAREELNGHIEHLNNSLIFAMHLNETRISGDEESINELFKMFTESLAGLKYLMQYTLVFSETMTDVTEKQKEFEKKLNNIQSRIKYD